MLYLIMIECLPDIEKVKIMEKSKKRDRKLKKSDKYLLILIACCVCAFNIVWLVILPIYNPMRRPLNEATEYVLMLTPIGTHIDEVIEIVDGHRGWSIRRVNDHGFRHPRPSNFTPSGRPIFTVGNKSIIVDAGSFRPAHFRGVRGQGAFMETIVRIYYGFDRNGELIDVFVFRTSSH